MDVKEQSSPLLPRRAFLAGGLSAVLAGSGVALALIGGLSQVETSDFQFSRGVTLANGEEKRLRGILTRALPDERVHVTIVGHSGDVGDEAANLSLSEERAEMARSLALDLGIAPDRITSRGVGGAAPLSQDSGESDRAYQARLARVEVALQVRR